MTQHRDATQPGPLACLARRQPGGDIATGPDVTGRRMFLARASALGAAAWLGAERADAAEGELETTTVRLVHAPPICLAPQYLAAELLRAEGFTNVEYVKMPDTAGYKLLVSGQADFSMQAVTQLITHVDDGLPVVMLAGVHLGCYELFATDRIRAFRDLKGKTIPVSQIGGGQHVFLSAMLGYVGVDPRKDINWVVHSPADSMRLLAEGKVDAFLGFPPEPQELRDKKVGHVLINITTDRPWSQYYCCVLTANREFVRKNPVATKRALRAFLRSTDLCAEDPQRAARMTVERGFTSNYRYALQALQEVPYNVWRTHDVEDTVRFYAVRLREVGIVKSTPQEIIARGTDWRFLNELRRELKG